MNVPCWARWKVEVEGNPLKEGSIPGGRARAVRGRRWAPEGALPRV